MSSIDFGAKITGYEAKEWIRNILGDAEEGRIYDEEDFMTLLVKHKPVDFKAPRKSRASKMSSSERSEAEYDCQLCDARVWNADPVTKKGLGGQCSRKKLEDECLCVIHIKESGKHDGLLRNGFINGPRPVHAYGDDTLEFFKWHDVELPDKPVKKTSSGAPKGGKRKCSNCGEADGHNIKTCPLLKDNKVVEEVKVVLDEIVDTVVEGDKVVEGDTHDFLGGRMNNEDGPVVEEGYFNAEPEPEEEEEDVSEPEPEEEPEEETEEVVSEPEPEEEPEEETEVEESLVTNDTELDEDEGTMDDEWSFEGVVYSLDTDDNLVYDDELSELGQWDPESSKIEWNSTSNAKLHNLRKMMLKKD